MAEPEGSDPEERATPFDNPFFLPVLLLGLGLWFAYDGWLNPEIESIQFNRIGAVVLLCGAAWTGLRALRARRREAGGEPPQPD